MAVLQFPLTLRTPGGPGTELLSPIRRLRPVAIESRRLAPSDLVWGIPSRHVLLERLQLVGELAPNAPLSFLAVEVTGLYAVSRPTEGAAPDTLLQAVARSLRELTRSTDMVGRLSASSFGIVLQGTGEMAAGAVAARLSFHLNQLAEDWPGSEVRVSAATGTGVNALVLPSAATDSSEDCC